MVDNVYEDYDSSGEGPDIEEVESAGETAAKALKPDAPGVVSVKSISSGSSLLNDSNFTVTVESISGKQVVFGAHNKALQWLTMRRYHKNPLTGAAAALYDLLKTRRNLDTVMRQLATLRLAWAAVEAAPTNARAWQGLRRPMSKLSDPVEQLSGSRFGSEIGAQIQVVMSKMQHALANEGARAEHAEITTLLSEVPSDISISDNITPDV